VTQHSHRACGLYAHVTWHTWRWAAQLRKCDVPVITESILNAASRTGVRVHAQAVLSDHVHVLVSFPPQVALASFFREAKSESARRVNAARRDGQRVRWCRGYYAGSLSRDHVRATRIYIARQFQRHPDRIPC
jgi:REP element-mobilizing transposase RayT